MDKIREVEAWKANGFFGVAVMVVIGLFALILIASFSQSENEWIPIFITTIGTIIILGSLSGFIVVQPNEARVLVLFGKYCGSIKQSGLWWVNPLASKKKISLRIYNFNSEKLKVNDLTGNPIEIGAVIVWSVVDTARALFDVENYLQFVNIQTETAIRSLAIQYPYDTHEEGKPSLRGSQAEVSENLRIQVQSRLELAGVAVTEARITHLAYSPEIAQTMLRRQQAAAIISARQRIVEGAVGMVEMALKMLGDRNILVLDDEKKASMTNNLLVALISDHEVTPIVNAGTLY